MEILIPSFNKFVYAFAYNQLKLFLAPYNLAASALRSAA